MTGSDFNNDNFPFGAWFVVCGILGMIGAVAGLALLIGGVILLWRQIV